MQQQERLAWLIDALIAEDARLQAARTAGELAVPSAPDERYALYRSLVNVRPPQPAPEGYLEVEDAYLQQATRERGIVTLADVRADASARAGDDALLLWRGDITRLALDAIVNAANEQLLGCFVPCHGCIDNAIHTAAGLRLRRACDRLMRAQGTPEPPGRAKLTPGFNLPAGHVLHTVGPIVGGAGPSERDCELLASCYRACLDLAAQHELASVAFCSISTGEFHFPKERAAAIATRTVCSWQREREQDGLPVPAVVFDVFSHDDEAIYQRALEDIDE